MKKEKIEEIGKQVGLTDDVLNVFVEFFSRRFPNEDDRITSYVAEWADRFKSGHPENYMDGQSKAIYDEVNL